MQTFLPYPNYRQSAECLDPKRLGKQRIEAMQIIRILLYDDTESPWYNHPCVRMWNGHLRSLLNYYATICEVWMQEYKQVKLPKLRPIYDAIDPPWLGGPLHATHRSNLLRKKPEHYSQFNWTEPNDLAYIWGE